MTEEEKKYITDQVDKVDDIGEISDGYHTFNSLYNQRLYLFAALVNAYPHKSWKTKKHEDGEPCFGGGWFLVGIETRKGTYSYHYELKYWDLFHCKEVNEAPPFDGHTDKDVSRLMYLGKRKYIPMEKKRRKWFTQYWNGRKVEINVSSVDDSETKTCDNCGIALYCCGSNISNPKLVKPCGSCDKWEPIDIKSQEN